MTGLADNHPDLFERAKAYEKVDPESGKRFTWVQGMTLEEVKGRREEVGQYTNNKRIRGTANWQQSILSDDAEDAACLICTL